MIKLGITGGIASGKSTVCQVFSLLGVPIYSSDERAKQLMLSHTSLRKSLQDLFGEQTYLNDGRLNKTYLSEQIFSSNNNRLKMNAVVHPIVANDFQQWSKTVVAPCGYVIQESALLVESQQWKNLDKILTVTCNEHERKQRIMKRLLINENEAQIRIDSQTSDEERIAISHYVLSSDNDSLLIKNILKIHNTILSKNEN